MDLEARTVCVWRGEALEPTGRSVEGGGGTAKIEKIIPARLGTQEGGCISNDLLKKRLNVCLGTFGY